MTLDEIRRNLEIAIQDETATYQDVARAVRQIRALLAVARAAQYTCLAMEWEDTDLNRALAALEKL